MMLTMLYLLFQHMVNESLLCTYVYDECCVLCVVLSGLLPEAHSALSHHLLAIPTVTVGVVCLEFKGRVLPPEYEEVSVHMHGLRNHM